jgi:hypothetical protein
MTTSAETHSGSLPAARIERFDEKTSASASAQKG